MATGLQDVNDWCRHSYISASPAGSCVERNIMANLPKDRLMVGPLFEGLDVFGPWQVMTRKTRGGIVNNKRWAVLFLFVHQSRTH